jgi:hypothetical protein
MTASDEPHRVSRREALALAATSGVGIEVLRAAGASPGVAATSGGGASVIMLIRHAEKPPASGPPFGITANGQQDPESLTVQGWQRAGALVELFDPKVGKLRKGITRPTALFASSPGSHGSKRPLETVTPLAQRLKMTVSTPVKDSKTRHIAEILVGTPGAPLAAWQHQDIPSIAGHIGSVHPTPPAKWPGHRFDIVWVFTRQSGGSWKFTQVPQLLLAGDKRSVIE